MLMLVSLLVPMALIGSMASGGGGDEPTDETINGNGNDNNLEGGFGDDLLQGRGGDDVLQGRAGEDTLFGHAGDDILEGADGDDMLCAGDGDDFITGNRGFDTIEGQGGNDWMSGDYNSDTIHGNDGDDTVIGGRGFDRVIGDDGDDVLFGGIIQNAPLSTDEMEQLRDGADLADVLGNGGQIDMRDDSVGNRLFAGAGDDELFLGSSDHAVGGVGEDTFNIMADMNTDSANSGPAVLTDYNEDDDAVTIVVTGSTANVDVDVTTTDGETAISVNGVLVGCIMNGAGENLTADDITVLRESDVADMFDPNAAA